MKELRPYQIESINAINSAIKRGVKSLALILPTGAGKTFTAVRAIKNMGRILWISNTEELISQSAIVLSNELNCSVGLIKADVFDIEHKVVMASAQTIHRRLERISPNYFDVVVADECDLFASATFSKSLDYLTPKLRLGLTATFFRNDNLPLDYLFSEIAYEYPIQDAIKEEYLTKPIAIKVKTSANLDDVHTLAGDFNQKELTVKVNTPERNFQIVNKYIEYGEGRQFIAFCTDIAHTIDLCEAFKEKGIDCNYVVGDKELTTDRKGIIEAFKRGEVLGLTNCNILTAGFDHPDTGCLIMAAPTKSKRRFFQQFGRGMRLKSEEFVAKFSQNLIILDIVDGTTRHKIVNCDSIDAELDLDSKIFISDINRQKLMDAKLKREATMEANNRQQDEIFELFPLPKVKRYYSARLNEPCTEAQLYRLKSLGYPVETEFYTKNMFAEIMANQSAAKQDIDNLASAGYDVSRGCSQLEAAEAFKEVTLRDSGKIKTKR